MGNHGDDFFSMQLHIGDAYSFAWTGQRQTFYGVTGTPTTWFDGVLSCVGAYTNDQQMVTWYNSQINSRLAVPTDVTIELSAIESAAQTYDVTATVAIEPGGVGKEVKLHFVEVLDYYPSSADNRYRNCVVEHQAGGIYALEPGGSATVTLPFVLSGASWTYRENAKFVVFAREPGAPAPKEIYNTAAISWPFESDTVEGDVDGDGDVDLQDLAALLATYGLCDGDPGYNDAADFVDDDCIDLADLSALLGNYGYTP